MTDLYCTLLTDGPTDAVLVRHLDWLLRRHAAPHIAVQMQWADLRPLRRPPRGLAERAAKAVELFPCDLLFVHRDAERDDPAQRDREIERGLQDARCTVPFVPVVPVRMTEAWLLFDVAALRRAAGNPNGNAPLPIPIGDVESVPNPKQVLHECLRTASGFSGRRLHKFRTAETVHRIADCLDDFSPLLPVPAFRRLEHLLLEVLTTNGWS